METAVHATLEWISAHPHWAGLIVFLIAFGESLVVVGLFMPATLIMFGVGALVAVEALALGPTIAWAAAGAIAGDGVSFWIGRHLRERLREVWPFRTHPRVLERSEAFFRRHGGKSVFLARFVGPIRPIVPAVAGMLRMPTWRFAVINVISALLWAPAYLLPGMAVGASLALAAEVGARLAALAVALILLLWLVLWLLRRIFATLQPRAEAMLAAVEHWARRHPRLGRLALGLIDPNHPQLRSLLALAGVLVAAGWAFFGLLAVAVGGPSPNPLDEILYQMLQGLRTPLGDRVMIAVTALADWEVYVALTVAVLALLALRRRWTAAAYWAGAVGGGAVMTHALKWLIGAPRPPQPLTDALTHAFPSGHAAMATVTYGFLAVLIAREMQPARRWLPYLAAGALITPIAFSRLYLGAHWLTDVLGGVTLGIAWVAFLGIAYRHHAGRPVGLASLGALAGGVLLVGGAWHVARVLPVDLERYAPRLEVRTVEAREWWEARWRELPTHRADLRRQGRHPLTVQWAGPLESLDARLATRGWREPVPVNVPTILRFLDPTRPIDELPVLPHVHDGRYDTLTLVHPAPADEEDSRYVLRLWGSRLRLADGREVWIGNVSRQTVIRPLRLLSYPRTQAQYTAPLELLQRDISATDLRIRTAQRGDRRPPAVDWDGRVLLITAPGSLGHVDAPAGQQRMLDVQVVEHAGDDEIHQALDINGAMVEPGIRRQDDGAGARQP